MRRMTMLALVLMACASTPEGTVSITLGEENDALSRAPAPTTLVVETLALDRTKKEISRSQLPEAGDVSLGDLPRTDVGAIAATALGADGKTLLRGETLYVQWGALEGQTLEVFLQRTGELARVPRGPASFDATIATIAVGRYVLATNGTLTYLYDLLNLRPVDAPPTFPSTARSLAVADATAMLIDDAGKASAFDLQTRAVSDLTSPTGGPLTDVAGGATIRATDGTQYIVGATRTSGGPTTRILSLSVDGVLGSLALVNAREGACAAWVESRGLVVYGGSATAPGAEVVAPGATQSAVLPYPPDEIKACGATALDGSHVMIAREEARVIDLGCAADCKPATWQSDVKMNLTRAESFALAPDAALVVGDDAAGATHVFRASATGHREIPLKNPRKGAHLVALPQNGYAAIVAGGAAGIEQYVE